MIAETETKPTSSDDAWEIIKVVVQALAIAFIVRVFLFQPFVIPSGSMENTLLVGDYVFVSKYSYGYSKYSFSIPTLLWSDIVPVDFAGRIWPGEPQRGDVIVFRFPPNPTVDYIKRLIGLPGDEIQVQGGILYINGKAVPKAPAADFVESDPDGGTHNIQRFEETLPNGVKFHVLSRPNDSQYEDTPVYKVPAGHYFMMGDNRDNSSDSRVPVNKGGVGFVPFENLVGRAQIVFFSCDTHCIWFEPWTWPTGIRWSRLFSLIH